MPTSVFRRSGSLVLPISSFKRSLNAKSYPRSTTGEISHLFASIHCQNVFMRYLGLTLAFLYHRLAANELSLRFRSVPSSSKVKEQLHKALTGVNDDCRTRNAVLGDLRLVRDDNEPG